MPIPFQAIAPLCIVGGSLYLGSILINKNHQFFHNGRPQRFSLDDWDKRMSARDRRIVGAKIVQYVYIILQFLGSDQPKILLASLHLANKAKWEMLYNEERREKLNGTI